MHMADRDGQGIGGVVRRWRGGKTEEQFHHLRHLVLLGASVPDDRALDFGRRVLDHLTAGFNRGKHRHATRVTELQRAADVRRVEETLDGDAVRMKRRKEHGELGVNPGKAVWKRVGLVRGNGAAGDEVMPASIRLHAAVTGAFGARIDAENPHAREASISFSSMSKFAQTCWTSSWSSIASISRSICCASLPTSFT